MFDRKSLLALLLCGAAILPALPAAAEPVQVATRSIAGQPEVAFEYERFTLPNGLTAIVYSDTSVPNVYVGVRYRIGSRYEPAGRTGFAHLFEHLMFGPTANRASSYFDPLRAAGATDINGSTTEDWTEYYEVVPAHALNLALWMESDRMQYLMGGVNQTVLDEQREVVKNEKRQRGAGPGVKGYEQYLANFFPADHPYAHPVIGSMADLDAATLADVNDWYENYYGASNAVLVVSGNVTVDEAKKQIAHYFGDVRPGKPIDALSRYVPQLGSIKRNVIHDRMGAVEIDRTWPVETSDPRTITYLQLVSRAMAGTPESFLPRRLVEEERVALNVSAALTQKDLVDTFAVTMQVAPGIPLEQAQAALDKALADFVAQGPDQARIDAIHAASIAGLTSALDDPVGLGRWLLSSAVEHNDPAFFVKQTNWVAEATSQALTDALGALVSAPYYETVSLPEVSYAPAEAGSVDRSQVPDASPPTGPIPFPAISETTLPNGLRIVVGERPGTRTTTAALMFDAGSDLDEDYAPGTAAQALSLLTAGTRTRDRLQLQKAINDLGGSLGATAGDRDSTVTWTVPSDRFAEGFALAAEVVREPRYPEELVDAVLRGIDANYDGYEKNPSGALRSLFARAIWGPDNPKGLIPTRELAKSLSLDAIRRFHNTELGPNNATLYVVGAVTPEDVEAMAKRYLGDWQPTTPTPHPAVLPAQPASGTIVLIDAPNAEQSIIAAGMPVSGFDADSAAADSLVAAILGADFSSRLNMELRERRGWAYGFRGGIQNAPEGERVLSASGSVQTDKTADAMALVRNIIAGIATSEPVTQAELDDAQRSAVLAVPTSYSENRDYLMSMASSASYGQPLDRGATAAQRLAAVTLPDVQERARELIDPSKLTWVVIGDLSQIEAPIRAANLGRVEVRNVYGDLVR
ncbi:M16 family metallopeptidase [Aurantiacibacter xanthus]|nr:pitrilysin family protein [Aurantiacibacter xanthus]